MGYAIAAAAVELGAETTLITGPTALTPPSGVKVVAVESTSELHEAVNIHFALCDCLIMAAAPSDYRPLHQSDTKLKRAGSLQIDLEPTVDILRDLAPHKNAHQVVVGFALETDDGIANAQKKLREKQLDLIVLNSPGAESGFSTDTNRVTIIRRGGEPEEWPLLPKEEVARRLVGLVGELLGIGQ